MTFSLYCKETARELAEVKLGYVHGNVLQTFARFCPDSCPIFPSPSGWGFADSDLQVRAADKENGIEPTNLQNQNNYF